MKYDPPDENACDIVETLRYEARFTEIAIAVQDESTESFGLMCRTAADEIERMREERKTLISALEGMLDVIAQGDTICAWDAAKAKAHAIVNEMKGNAS